MRTRLLATTAVIAISGLALTGCSSSDDGDNGSNASEAMSEAMSEEMSEAGGESMAGALTGTIVLDSGECAEGDATGSTFRMVQPDGTLTEGPYIENGDSTCADKTFTPLIAGTTGLTLGAHQPFGDPVFDEAGNALVDTIFQPTPFFAVGFGLATPQIEPQTELEVPAPSIEVAEDGTITGDMSAFAIAYNGSYFAQGSPAPDGTMPGLTTPVTGTYDAATGAISIEWAAQIVGGAFNNFTGIWHIEGTLESGA